MLYMSIPVKGLFRNWVRLDCQTAAFKSVLRQIKNLNDDMFISVYLSLLLVAHLSNAPRRRLVVTGDSSRIQDKTTESSAWLGPWLAAFPPFFPKMFSSLAFHGCYI